MFLTKFSLKNTVSIIILSILVLLGGIYATSQIKVQTFPDVSFPSVLVQATYMGASTEEVVNNVTTPLENGLLQLKGIDNVTSTTSEFSSNIFITYPFNTDMEKAVNEVDGIVKKTSFPKEVKLNVQRMSVGAQPIYEVAVSSSKENLQALLENNIVPGLEKINGVNSVKLTGTKTAKLVIEVNKEKANEKGITINQIKDAVESKNYTLPLGTLDEAGTTIPLQLQGNLTSMTDLENISL